MSANTPDFNFEEFSQTLEQKRKQAKRKAYVFTLIPIVASILLFAYCTASIRAYERKVETLSDSAKWYDSVIALKEKRVQDLDKFLGKVIDSANLGIRRTDISGDDSSFVVEIARHTPAIVFIQVADLEGKRIGGFKKKVQQLGYTVPEVEIMNADDYPNHVMYYYKEDSVAAYNVLATCHEVYTEKTFSIERYTGKKYKAPQGQIEVWIKNQ